MDETKIACLKTLVAAVEALVKTIKRELRPDKRLAMVGDSGELFTETRSRDAVASEWLVNRFRDKLEWSSEDLFRQAKEDGISRNAVFEAKVLLDLPRARQNIARDGSKTWVWWVPDNWPYLRSQKQEAEVSNGE